MECDFVITKARRLIYVKLTNKSVAYVSTRLLPLTPVSTTALEFNNIVRISDNYIIKPF